MFSSFSRRMVLACACSVVLSLWSCTESPVSPETPITSVDSAVIVVNQGTFNLDDASLTHINRTNDTVVLSWYAAANPGRKLGATANDIAFLGDTAFVTVTKSHAIEVINAQSGKHLATIQLIASEDPWNIQILSSQMGVVSTTNGDGLRFFNPQTFALLDAVHTGPATQGVTATATSIFVANSGYGTLRDTVPGAGTVSVVNIATHTVTHTLVVGKNVTEVQVSPDKSKLYAYYQELYTNTSAKQGIVEFDATTMLETRRWELNGMGFINCRGAKIYFIGKTNASDMQWSVMSIDLSLSSPTPQVESPIASSVSVNAFSVRPSDGTFWISDARDYSSNGTLLVLNTNGTVRHNYSVGLVPGKAAFYH